MKVWIVLIIVYQVVNMICNIYGNKWIKSMDLGMV